MKHLNLGLDILKLNLISLKERSQLANQTHIDKITCNIWKRVLIVVFSWLKADPD